MEIVSFGADNIDNVFLGMTPRELDEVPFGVIQVSKSGQVLLYNATEGMIASYDPKAAVGKNFFTEVAPCTNQPGFRGKFDEGVKAGNLNVVFEWRFTDRNATMVQVHMKGAVNQGIFWIFVKRL